MSRRLLFNLRNELELMEDVLAVVAAEHLSVRAGIERHLCDLREEITAGRGPRPSLEEMLAKVRRRELYPNLEEHLNHREWANYPLLGPMWAIWSTPACMPGTADFEYVLAACFGQGLALQECLAMQGVQVEVHHTFASPTAIFPVNMHITRSSRSHAEYLDFVLGPESIRTEFSGPIARIASWLKIPVFREYHLEAFTAISKEGRKTDAAICDVIFHALTAHAPA